MHDLYDFPLFSVSKQQTASGDVALSVPGILYFPLRQERVTFQICFAAIFSCIGRDCGFTIIFSRI